MITAVLQAVSKPEGPGILGDGRDVSLPYGLTIESTLLLELLAVAAVVGIWFLVYGAVLTATRPADVDPLPAHADLPGDLGKASEHDRKPQ